MRGVSMSEINSHSSVVAIEDLSYHYGEQYVLQNINLTITKGSFLALVGPNGSGKSTLIKCILGLLSPQRGSIKLFGKKLHSFKEWDKIGYVSQKANNFNNGFPATVYEVVAMGLYGKIGMFRFLKKSDKEKIRAAVKSVGMTDYMNRNIGELSGGQQQRVFIARALVSDPQLLILDEPTVGVDAASVQAFYNMLEHLNENEGITLILVTHDIGTVTNLVTDVACLNKQLHFHGKKDKFTALDNDHLSSLYGHHVQVVHHNH
jgi:zinc transport system ATP-binding protein